VSIPPTRPDRDRSWQEVVVLAGLSAVPYAGGPLSVVADELLARRRRRVAELGVAVLEGHDVEDLLDRLRSDERFGELFVRAAEATAISGWEPKRRAMGAVIRSALDGEDAELDDSELLIAALERLEAPHFAALQRLDQAPDSKMGDARAEQDAGLAAPVLAGLLSTGAVSQGSGWGGMIYASSDFGRRLLGLVAL